MNQSKLKENTCNQRSADKKRGKTQQTKILRLYQKLPVVMFSLPKISSSATRPPMLTSSLARSWDFDQFNSSFSGSWETFRKGKYKNAFLKSIIHSTFLNGRLQQLFHQYPLLAKSKLKTRLKLWKTPSKSTLDGILVNLGFFAPSPLNQHSVRLPCTDYTLAVG